MPAAPSPDSHAGLMDRVYRRQRHVYDFTRKYYLFGRDRLIRDLVLPPGASLVEVGCGTARNLIAIAKAYPGTRLYGLDASKAMLESARMAIERAGLEHRILLRQGLAEDFTPAQFEVESFENVLFSYSLSMIPDWRGALAAGSAALSPSGRLHVVDFGDLAGLGQLGEHAMRSWLRLFHVTPRVEFLSGLERVAGERGHLTLLFGRYAFIFSQEKM
ncbi:MAG: class I SAM-dependent methyltransferase [Proteobacteria bacterium]|nr:class I SAM-dependent methyltransferase [Pseudomonadota bacterium]